MLFVWARSLLIADQLGASLIAPSWTKLVRIGPWLRREKYKRYYLSDFTNDGYIDGAKKFYLSTLKRPIDELHLDRVNAKQGDLIRVHNSADHMIYFPPLLGHEKRITEELFRITNPKVIGKYTENNSRYPNYIGVHIRRGDFSLINQTIPLSWYRDAIHHVRESIDTGLPVLVFSDAQESELVELNNTENVFIMPRAPAIHDLLMLANSDAIIGTSLSTFSLWASFLNRRPSYWPPISPGVHGYGLDKSHHHSSDWQGRPLPFDS